MFDCSDAPEINISNRRIGQKLGGEVVLECVVAGVPAASHYWTRDSLPIAMPSKKYVTDEYDELDGRVTLRLSIRNLQSTDYGDYQCVAANKLGSTHRTVTLYGSLTHSFLMPMTHVPETGTENQYQKTGSPTGFCRV